MGSIRACGMAVPVKPMVEIMADNGGPDHAGRLADGVRHTLVHRAFRIVYQPIVELADGRVVVVEALSRFSTPPHQPPDAWFADAWRVGLGADLELAALEAALAGLGRLPAHCRMAINVSAAVITHEELSRQVLAAGATRIIIELTEQAAVDDYDHVRAAVDALRERGALLAIDDIGAGFASIRHIVRLVPDIIKLDRDLVDGIDTDPVRKNLAEALVRFAAAVGSDIVAEGIETTRELRAVRELGIRYGQGYLLGPPARIESLRCCQSMGPMETPAITALLADLEHTAAARPAASDVSNTVALLARLLDAAKRGTMSADPTEIAALERAAATLAQIAERESAGTRVLVPEHAAS